MVNQQTCKRCGLEQPIDNFNNGGKYKNNQYLSKTCKTCKSLYDKEYHKKNRSRIIERSKVNSTKYQELRRNDPELHKKFRERPGHIESLMFNSAKFRAKKSGLEFTITRNDIIIPEYCPILNIKLERNNHGHDISSPTLDRVDNSRGYTPDNIRVISDLANMMKNRATFEQLCTFSKNILEYIKPYIHLK